MRSLAICFVLLTTATDAAKPSHIVMIMADDLGYGHRGSSGEAKIEAPNIRIAAEGMCFTAAYAASTV